MEIEKRHIKNLHNFNLIICFSHFPGWLSEVICIITSFHRFFFAQPLQTPKTKSHLNMFSDFFRKTNKKIKIKWFLTLSIMATRKWCNLKRSNVIFCQSWYINARFFQLKIINETSYEDFFLTQRKRPSTASDKSLVVTTEIPSRFLFNCFATSVVSNDYFY